jgi:STELLO glycosyltransferases
MKKFIVITSIYEPTAAVIAFAGLQDYQLVVVGDTKTGAQWHCEGATYLSIDDQHKTSGQLAKLLPFNHYSRKMMGYLYALANGAETIIDTDDDNIPCTGWGFPEFKGVFPSVPGDEDFINIYQLYSSQHIWPRGLPLSLVTKQFELEKKLVPGDFNIGIWQGLADGNPDVDAVYRLTSDAPCHFKKRDPVVLGINTLSPFNTQNTAFRKEMFALLYLPVSASFRFTDILRGLVAQPIMWLYNYHLGFTNATVVQERNPHDYQEDFISEIPMYQHSHEVHKIVGAVISGEKNIRENLVSAYRALAAKNIVSEDELITLEAWLEDLEECLP